ncbi:MAG TPA: M1 family peptidase [Caldithrix abyssi]|uniref:M1 family peptidase n=1 Tax=Caldithrix abyssi TaxID=187145 RepID=A0A7V4U1Y4_CALAY|nr:M1 family peptidase [Caldithrix abyssi]
MKQLYITLIFFLGIGLSIALAAPPDVVQYKIDVRLDTSSQMLYGKEILTWHNLSNDRVKDIYLHLYWNAFKNEESAYLSESAESQGRSNHSGHLDEIEDAGWIRLKQVTLSDGRSLKEAMQYVTPDLPRRPGDQTVLRIDLPEVVQPGGSVRLHIDFEAKIPKAIARAGYYNNNYFISQWFPKPGVYQAGKGWNCHAYHYFSEFFADFADFDVRITVPQDFVVGASGVNTERVVNDTAGTVTYRYQQNHIHDFAWTAGQRFIKKERLFNPDSLISEDEYRHYASLFNLPLDSVRLTPVKLILLIRPEHENQIERHFQATEQSVKYLGLWFGRYPYPTLTVVDPPYRTGSSGMEYPTLVTAATRPIIAEEGWIPDGVIAHEFAHNYWYGMAANNEFEEAWLDEGITTYSEDKVMQAMHGKTKMIVTFGPFPISRYFDQIRYSSWERARSSALHIVETDPVVTPSWQFYDIYSYFLNVYERTALNLFTLERLLGKDTMLRVLRTFQSRYRYRHPTTQDFIGIVNEVSGRDMRWFFDEFFYGDRLFDYGVGSLVSHKIVPPIGVFDSDSGMVVVSRDSLEGRTEPDSLTRYKTIVRVRRYGQARPGGDVRIKLLVAFADSTTETRYWDGRKRWQEFRFETAARAVYAQVDPDTLFLLDANLANNSYRTETKSAGINRWAGKFLFWLQNLLTIITLIS